MQSFPWKFTAGDTLPQLAAALTGVDMTGYTCTLEIQRPADVLRKVATASSSGATWPWTNTDLQAGFNQVVDVVIVNNSSQQVTSQRFTIDVKAALP